MDPHRLNELAALVDKFNEKLETVQRQKIEFSDGEFHENYSGRATVYCSYRVPMWFGPAWD